MFDPTSYQQNCLTLLDQIANNGYSPEDRVNVDDFNKKALLHGAGSEQNKSTLPIFVKEMRSNTTQFKDFMEQLNTARDADILAKRVEFANSLAMRTTLHPSYSQQLETQLHNMLDMSLGEAGKAGLDMQQAAQSARATVDYAGMLAVNDAVRNFVRTVDDLAKAKRLSPGEKLTLTIVTTDYAGYDVIVPTTKAAQVAVEAKRQKFNDYLSSLGFSIAQVDRLKDAAKQIYTGYEDLYRQAHALGLPVGDVRYENAMHLHRVYTSGGADALRTLDTGDLIEDVTKDNLGLSSVIDAETGFFTYAVNDEVAFAIITGMTPGDHLFVRGGTTRNKNIKLTQLGGANSTSFKVASSDAPTLLYLNQNVTDSKVDSVNGFREKARTEVKAHYISEINNNSSFNATTVEVMDFLNIPAVRTSDTEAFIARQGYFGNNSGTFVTMPANVLDDWEINHGLVDAVARTATGAISASPVNRVNTLNDVLKNRVISFVGNKSANTQIVVDTWLTLNNADVAVVTPGKAASIAVAKTGFDTNTLITNTQFEWYAGRAEALQDSQGNFSSQYINPSAKVFKRDNPGATDVKQQLTNDLLYDKYNKVTDPVVIARLRDNNISEIELRDIAKTHYQSLGYDAWMYENIKRGEYYIIPFDNNVLTTFDPSDVNRLLQDEIATLDFMIGTSYIDPKTGTRVTTPGRISHAQLDQLVDSGILSRLRMPSIDVVNYLVGKYNLPFHTPAMMVSADLPYIMERYVNSLKDGAANSAVVTSIIRDGEKLGWAVRADQVVENDAYSDWTKLNDKHIELLKDLNWTPEMIQEAANYRFHPTVTELLAKQLFVASDPEILGTLGKFLKLASDIFVTGMLAGSNNLPGMSYIQGNLLTDGISSLANGGNIHTVIHHTYDVIKTFAANSVSHLSNKPKYLHPDTGAPISHRDAMEMFMKHYAQQAAAGTTDVATGLVGGLQGAIKNVMFGAIDQYSMTRWAWSQNIGVAAPAGKAVKRTEAALMALSKVTRGMLTPAVVITSILQRGIMFNHMTSLLTPVNHNPVFGVLGRVVKLGFFQGYATSMDDLWLKMDRVFIYGDKAGSVTKALHDTNLMNFAAYTMKTPFNVIRQMANNPIPYYNFLRLLQFQHEVAYEQQEVNQLQVADYELASNHSLVGSYERNGQRHGLALYNSYNPYSQTLNLFDGLSRTMGVKPDTYEMYLKSTYTNDFQLGMERINQLMLENAGAVSKMAFEIATGIDANTMLPFREGDSDKKASFLFTDTLPNRVSSALSYLPFISAFDRNNFQHLFGWKMMETPIFGAGSEVDPWTGEVLEPGRGGITGNERFPVRNADRLKDAPQIVGVAREIGFDFKAIAYEQNEVRSIRNLDRAVDKLSTEFADIQKQLNDATVKGTYISPSNVENLRNRASRITDNYLTLRLMQAQLDAYAYDQNKFPPRLQGRLENAAYQRYLGNGESVLQFELEQLIEETSQVYEQIDDLDLANR